MATGQVLKLVQPKKATKTEVDTILITKAVISGWKLPPFQRPLRVNEKVRALAAQIRDDGAVIPGMLTIGKLGGDMYIVDGQHRCHAFLLSELPHGYADVRKCRFESISEMAEEFVTLNSSLVKMGPDDILRGLEASNEHLQEIRRRCPYVGYDQIRRSEKSPLLSMSMVLRSWFGSQPDVPCSTVGSAASLAGRLTDDDSAGIAEFLAMCFKAWGREKESWRLWGMLNTTLCAWLYRRTVIGQYSAKSVRLSKDLFAKCLMSLAADPAYSDWLVGRAVRDRDRSPGYQRIKSIFARRYQEEMGRKAVLPAPAWTNG